MGGEVNSGARSWAAVALLLLVCVVSGAAQSRIAEQQVPQTPQVGVRGGSIRQARQSADETFELDIDERRITELDFFASTEVGAGGESAPGLNLRVGVGVGAERIDALLRNVRGSVRFRGSLEALRRVLGARRGPSAAPARRDVP